MLGPSVLGTGLEATLEASMTLSGGEGRPSGFLNIDFGAREASYDPARGLVLSMPVEAFNPGTSAGDQGELTVTINQSSGEVTAEVTGS